MATEVKSGYGKSSRTEKGMMMHDMERTIHATFQDGSTSWRDGKLNEPTEAGISISQVAACSTRHRVNKPKKTDGKLISSSKENDKERKDACTSLRSALLVGLSKERWYVSFYPRPSGMQACFSGLLVWLNMLWPSKQTPCSRAVMAINFLATVSATPIHKPICRLVTCTDGVSREEIVNFQNEPSNFGYQPSGSPAFAYSLRWDLLLELLDHVDY